MGGRYSADAATALGQSEAELVVNLSASPFAKGKRPLRQDVTRGAARRAGVPVVQVNVSHKAFGSGRKMPVAARMTPT